jgi:capsular polysaccharide biosynthesis protein
VWSDHVMHPGAAALMRDRLRERPNGSGDGQAICLERTGPGRTIENMAEIRARLEDRGFTFHTVSALRFIDQVRLFQSASTIFAILGSDLSGLIYAPKGASLITAAPSVFGDRFFYAMLLERRGRYADLRGPVTRLDPGAEHRSSFHLDASEIGSALTALEYAS